MKLGFYLADQNPSRDRSLGITAYTDGLLHALAAGKGVDLVGLTSTSSYEPREDVKLRRLPFSTSGAVKRLLADNLHSILVQSPVDLWHYPKGHLPLLSRYRTPLVGTVHDLIVEYYAERYPADRNRVAYLYWRNVLRHSIAGFDLILTVSRSSETAIREFCAKYQIPCPPIRVTYEGFVVHYSPVNRSSKNDVAIHLASSELHKRTSTLLHLWRELHKRRKDLPVLRLVGKMRPRDLELARTIPHVVILDRISRAELESEIAHARALILPSEIEGFGLPAVEAYALGTPVIYVADTAVAEVLGKAAPGAFRLDEPSSFEAALDEVLGLDESFVRQRADRLARQYAWSRCAAETVDAYREVISGRTAAT